MTRAFDAVRRLAQDAVSAGVVPGAVVLVSADGQIVFEEAFGHRQQIPEPLVATVDTIYDVASVTKAVVTAVLAMQAVGRGALRLDDAVVNHVPEFIGDGKGAVTVRHLLSHSSGLPAHRPFYERVVPCDDRRLAIMRAAASEPLAAAPGAKSVYTDLGFILLGWILERVAGERLDHQAQRTIFQPLGLTATAFAPVGQAWAPTVKLAATEHCPVRERVVVGEVHDLNAFALDGVAGHAGLFSTAAELATIARALRAAWHGDARASLVERDVIREFWRPADVPNSNWRLGWDGPAPHGSQAGERISRAAVGHLGFTGCSLWIEPANDRFVVLLSNRIHPTVRDDPRFRAFRPAVHDAVFEALG